jgi:ribosomal-protein-alanine N-acetyltransferase
MDGRRKVVAVVGDGGKPHREKTMLVGEWIAQSGCHLLTGGGGGVMASVSDYFGESAGRPGLAIGVIPGSSTARGSRFEYRTKGSAYPNYSVEVAVFTHLAGEDPEGERSRNHVNVLSADLVVALPGGVGTHAEIQLAKRYGKPVLLFLTGADSIFGKSAENLAEEGFAIVHDMPGLIAAGNRILDPEGSAQPPVRIPLDKCLVRSWQWADAEPIQRHANSRLVWRNLLDGFPSPYTVRDARRWLVHALSMSPETAFAIDVDGEAVGGIGFVPKEGTSSRSAEVGYWLGEKHWGRGIATDSLRAVTAYAFAHYPDLQRLYAHAFEWNAASMRVLEKAGYVKEGMMRKAAVKAGQVIDLALYAVVR